MPFRCPPPPLPRWFTEREFANIHDVGLNVVRLPIGCTLLWAAKAWLKGGAPWRGTDPGDSDWSLIPVDFGGGEGFLTGERAHHIGSLTGSMKRGADSSTAVSAARRFSIRAASGAMGSQIRAVRGESQAIDGAQEALTEAQLDRFSTS